MCFSAEASFIASIFLFLAGIYCFYKAIKLQQRSLFSLALMPLFFSVQQAAEGLVWVGLAANEKEGSCMGPEQGPLPASVIIPALIFLFFALDVWPTYFLSAASALEDSSNSKKKLLFGVLSGLSFVMWSSGWILPLIARSDELGVRVVAHSIYYDYFWLPVYQLAPDPAVFKVVYWLFTLVPLPFISSPYAYIIQRFGVLALVAALLTMAFLNYAYTSIWCFFCALLSSYLAFAFSQIQSPSTSPSQEKLQSLSS